MNKAIRHTPYRRTYRILKALDVPFTIGRDWIAVSFGKRDYRISRDPYGAYTLICYQTESETRGYTDIYKALAAAERNARYAKEIKECRLIALDGFIINGWSIQDQISFNMRHKGHYRNKEVFNRSGDYGRIRRA